MSAPFASVRRVLIADDEPLARERLRRLLAAHTGYEVIAECEHGASALAEIERLRPDVVLLDIRMPEASGLEVMEEIAERRRTSIDAADPAVVLVTAYDDHALRAIELHALDYLMKPVDAERLARALARVEERLQRGDSAFGGNEMRAFLEELRAERRHQPRFVVRDARGLYFVRASDIEWVDAQGNYVGLHAGGRVHLVRDTMKAFEARLDQTRFLRVHRSAIVNLDHVQRLEPHGHGEYVITLRSGTRLTSSRAYGERLHALLRSA